VIPPSSLLSASPLHDDTARILLLRLGVEHLALRAQPITLSHQVINLLTALQHTLNSLVQHDLGLIQLLLDLDDAVRLRRVLVLGDVLFQLGEGERGLALGEGGVGGAGVLGDELVDDLGEDAVGDHGRVLVVGDYDAADAFCAAVGVECVFWHV
jgi:hypothetical protein